MNNINIKLYYRNTKILYNIIMVIKYDMQYNKYTNKNIKSNI